MILMDNHAYLQNFNKQGNINKHSLFITQVCEDDYLHILANRATWSTDALRCDHPETKQV